jgi:hypothetical protein
MVVSSSIENITCDIACTGICSTAAMRLKYVLKLILLIHIFQSFDVFAVTGTQMGLLAYPYLPVCSHVTTTAERMFITFDPEQCYYILKAHYLLLKLDHSNEYITLRSTFLCVFLV